MRPMSKTKRRIYFVLFFILFLLVTPLVILYALGYRFDFAQRIVVTERGGVYVYTSLPGTNIYIDGELKETTGIFRREYLSQSIRPGRYFVRAENEGYRSWEKYVQVHAGRVTSVYPFLVPEVFDFEAVPEFIDIVSVGTSTPDQVSNPLYDQYILLFEDSLLVLDTATTSLLSDDLDVEPVGDNDVSEEQTLRRVFGKIQVTYDSLEKRFYAESFSRGDFLPAYFCENEQCVNPFAFLEVTSNVLHFDFYPGRDDVIVFAVEGGGVYAAELDKRPQQTVVELYVSSQGNDVDFRILGRDTLVIRDGDVILTTELTR